MSEVSTRAVSLGSLLLLTVLAVPARAQSPTRRGAPPAGKHAGPRGKTEAKPPRWPALAREKEQRIKQLVAALRLSKKEARDRAEHELRSLGAAAAPALIARMSDFRVNVNDALERVLEAITARKHAPLLAREVRSRKRCVRLWALQRLAEWHVRELAPVFLRAMRSSDPEQVFRAATALVSTGDLEAMETVFARCHESWQDLDPWVLRALAGARGPQATAWIAKRIEHAGVLEQITGVRLLRVLGDRSAVPLAARYLDSEHHALKKAAINALRAIVDGDPPLDRLTVFQAIEMAKEWKKKL